MAPNHDLYKFKSKQSFYKPVDYVASKSMIPNFTRYIATLYGKRGIRANTIVPHGVIKNASKSFKKTSISCLLLAELVIKKNYVDLLFFYHQMLPHI